VVIWKGGRTEEGGRAIASHTGSLAVPQGIWDSAIKQCGAVTVKDSQELIDTLKALLLLPPVKTSNIGITGGTGGQSVAIADTFAEAGLKVPSLTQESYDELATFFTLIGGGYRNPIDTGNVNRLQMKRILDILERDAHTDHILLIMMMGSSSRGTGQFDRDVVMLEDLRKRTAKPMSVIISTGLSDQSMDFRNTAVKLRDVGVPAFFSLDSGALALRNVLGFYENRDRSPRR
jgi:acyl-CoA synthetase (NDP forming)